jgi:selenoprotein W-related protein
MPRPEIEIEYCTECRWLLRAAWMAQELLSTFGADLARVSLVPGADAVFEIRLDGAPIWNRRTDGGFPGAAELKRRVRDRIAPDRRLGHLDR